MKRFTAILSGFVLLAIAGCGSSGSGSNDIPDPQPVGLLSAVTDVAAFEASIKSGLTQMSTSEQLAAAGAAADANFTGTYTHCAATVLPLLLHPDRRASGA